LIGASEAEIIVQRDAENMARALVALARSREFRAQKGSVARQCAAVLEQEEAARIFARHCSLLECSGYSNSDFISSGP